MSKPTSHDVAAAVAGHRPDGKTLARFFDLVGLETFGELQESKALLAQLRDQRNADADAELGPFDDRPPLFDQVAA